MKFKTWIESTLEPSDVLGMVQSSPQMPKSDYDWGRYAERWGLNEPFIEGTMLVQDLVGLINGFRVRLSKHLDQSDIYTKVKTGHLNPVIITMPANEPQPLAIVDGSHSIVAAHQRKQESVDVLASESAARWLGMKFQAK